MSDWSEFHISIIYFTGLLVALIMSILVVLYLRPIKKTIERIKGKIDTIWHGSFKMTVILSGLLGAMSVTFKDCEGNYDYLLESRFETAMKGFDQVASCFSYLAIVLGIWFVIFISFRLIQNKKSSISGI